MKKVNIIKKNRDFTRIIKNQQPYRSNSFIIYKEKNNDEFKFGISVGTKVGNAVTRNKLKRQIKSILDKKNYYNNFNCIIIIRKDILNKSFIEIEKELLKCLNNLNIFKEEQNEK